MSSSTMARVDLLFCRNNGKDGAISVYVCVNIISSGKGWRMLACSKVGVAVCKFEVTTSIEMNRINSRRVMGT